MIDDITDVGKLQKFWNKHRLGSVNDELRAEALSEPSSPVGTRFSVSHERKTHRRRGLSDAAGFSRAHVLSQSHPALSMPRFLDTFGPLTFPIYRAALLRKRILLVGSAPVQQSCDFGKSDPSVSDLLKLTFVTVYDLSIFSNVPPSLTDVLPTPNSLLRIRPLFNVGIHDIPELGKKKEDDSAAAVLEDEGWLACTTDDILATKPQLYDYLVQLPPSQPDESAPKAWPTICTSDGKAVKATQRDLRRYAALRKGLRHMQNHKRRDQIYTDDESTVGDDNEDDTEPLVISTILEQNEDETEGGPLEGESTLVEPASWASIAYSSFLWWASAGEKDAMLADEDSLDSGLLEDLDLATSRRRSSSRGSGKDKRSSTGSRSSIPTDPDDVQGMAMVLIAYFHRLTSAMMETLSGLVAAADDETEDGVAEEVILIESDEVRRMGLDVWSNADKQFLQEVVQLYFERDAEVRSINVECCGIKIC